MNSESRLILEVWESVRDFVPAPKRPDIAEQMLRRFEEYGFDPGDYADLVGEDKYLEEAFNVLYAAEEEESLEEVDGVDDEIDVWDERG
jgi:hypothetical protein